MPDRDTEKETSRDFRINQEPDKILRLMESNLAGNQNYQVIGSGWLAYKAGELNSKATRSLTFCYMGFGVCIRCVSLGYDPSVYENVDCRNHPYDDTLQKRQVRN